MWMNKVNALFGLMMLATSLWLISLMTSFFSPAMVAAFAAALLLTLLWQLGRVKGRKPVIYTLAFLVLASGGGLIAGRMTADRWSTP
ncbi:hypothetical protein ABT58_23240, partial [Photobacterium aphoticum]